MRASDPSHDPEGSRRVPGLLAVAVVVACLAAAALAIWYGARQDPGFGEPRAEPPPELEAGK